MAVSNPFQTIGRVFTPCNYVACAASATTAMSATGAKGNYLQAVVITAGTTSPGVVQIQDGANTAITIFTGGSTSVTGLNTIYIPLGIVSQAGGWNIITGANVTALGIGIFS